MAELKTTPWSPEHVVHLNKLQNVESFHGYTCLNRGIGMLVATVRGWICPFCDYTQKWSH